ncbi:beta-galactosidase [Microbacterium sp. M3]|uniref:Beta-galactosidase n=2 Tax=Microbacterium arthrosphaerae TaxID=792652 RepID=A0ABU4GY70_9MICO|nr:MULTISPECIES: beta-galactosidase [Microbacterium]MDW4572004.1 beta-galactosidase [Microbacterium arthrosphaerae]MDW7605859.1 beta-galactosidase [Microbacterium sp. M3]
MVPTPTPRRLEAFADLTRDLGIAFGGDYNPEQWPREVWREDAELMVRAGVNLVTVGVFSWARLEPSPGAYDFDWLDEVLDLLHDHGIAVDLATPTASPPPWLGILHPETLPVNPDGVPLAAGSRNQFTPASRVYRERATAIATALAERYAAHPAVRMWHVGNEFGQIDYGDEAAREFRLWLRERYGSIQALNEAWGTLVWAQGYRDFDEIVPPRRMPYLVNPAQSLDFRRYTSWALQRVFTEQRDAIRATGATQPVTTNFMGFEPLTDLWAWAGDVDVIADDQYPDHAAPTSSSDIALVQDLMRSLGGGRPWLLMEQAISGTSWRPHNLPKTPARARLDSLQAVARGADAICFFQWRQARTGAERFHSALLPHAGADTELFAGVCALGADLQRLRPVVGGRVEASVAVLFDWESWWAAEEPARPTERLRTLEQVTRWHRALWRRGVAIDLVRPGADLSAYRAVLVPHSYIIGTDAATALRAAVEAGASLVVGPFSGVADANAGILTGRSPVLLRDLVGVSGEEWVGLPDAPTPLVAEPAWDAAPAAPEAGVLGERLRAEGAEVLARFDGGHLAGAPAITRHRVGAGTAWYLGAVPSDEVLDAVLGEALAAGGVTGAVRVGSLAGGRLPEGIEAVRRGDALFLLNHGDAAAHLSVPGHHRDLLSDADVDGELELAPGAALVLIERHAK